MTTNSIRLSAFLIPVIILLSVALFTARPVAADSVFGCVSVQFTPSNVEIGFQPNGMFSETEVTATVQLEGLSDYPVDEYKFSYYPDYNNSVKIDVYGGDQWYSGDDTRMTVVNETPLDGLRARVVYSFTFTVKAPGTVYYSIEQSSSNHVEPISNDSAGCQRDHEGEMTGPTVTLRPSAISDDQVMLGLCTDYADARILTGDDPTANYFQCVYSSQGAVPIWGDDSSMTYCDDTHQLNMNLCNTNNQNLTEYRRGYYCIRCSSSTPDPDQVVRLHTESCGGPNEVCAATNYLQCLDNPNSHVSGEKQCIYASPILSIHEVCVVGETECNPAELAAGGGGVFHLVCMPNAVDSVLGTCRAANYEAELACETDAKCVRELDNPRAYCDTDLHECKTPTADTNVSDTDPGIESDQFGAKKCPYQPPSTPCPQYAPSFVCDSLRTAAESRTGEQIAEYESCASCVNASGTYTALGCWNTSVSGIFTSLVRIALGVLGGVVLLRLIYLGYIYQTGDKKKIEEARVGVLFTMAGIVIVIFSVVILRVIGVNILDIVPGGFYG